MCATNAPRTVLSTNSPLVLLLILTSNFQVLNSKQKTRFITIVGSFIVYADIPTRTHLATIS